MRIRVERYGLRTAAWRLLVLAVAGISLAGCVSKSKAKLQAEAAYLAG